jgi:glycosyltransferase involved in cell wall biosynthesis
MEMSVALCFDGQIASELRSERVPTALAGEVRLSRPSSVWRARQSLARILRQFNPDIVVCHQPWTHAIFGPVARNASVPVALWMHMATTGHWIDRLAWRVPPDLIVCNSHFTASTLPPTSARVEVVYCPAVRRPAAKPKMQVRDELATSPADVVIVQVGRMEPLKGHRVCLEALSTLQERTGWTCWQIGGAQRPSEVQYFEKLKADADRLGIGGRVRFAGQRHDVPELLSVADIYCQPNVQPEAFGISFIEAMYAGLPVVTSKIGGAAEIVDASIGMLVPPGDSAALALALDRLITDRGERVRLGANGPRRASELCDPANQMRRVQEVLETVLSASPVAS